MELSEAVWALEGGYCLWVGAGITRQIAAGYAEVPLWDQVTHKVELAAKVEPIEGEDLPTRLDRCLGVLGHDVFRGLLREWYYTQLSEALLSQALDFAKAEDFVPVRIRSVAALGQLANPIVSFNIEPLSSIILARPAGPVRILFQSGADRPRYTWREPGGRFQRIVFHPHGLASADSIMTASQYKANRETLAFRLAIHAAFGNTLVIVGMSLNDGYLRQQIEASRASLEDIYWFDSHFPEKLATWAQQHEIKMVKVDWPSFWDHWHKLPVDIESSDLGAAWYLAISEASDEASGGSLADLQRAISSRPDAYSSSFRRLAESMAVASQRVGEPGRPRLVKGQAPWTVELAVRNRLHDANIPIPSIHKTYGREVSRLSDLSVKPDPRRR
jgi:hypothetical protein